VISGIAGNTAKKEGKKGNVAPITNKEGPKLLKKTYLDLVPRIYPREEKKRGGKGYLRSRAVSDRASAHSYLLQVSTVASLGILQKQGGHDSQEKEIPSMDGQALTITEKKKKKPGGRTMRGTNSLEIGQVEKKSLTPRIY